MRGLHTLLAHEQLLSYERKPSMSLPSLRRQCARCAFASHMAKNRDAAKSAPTSARAVSPMSLLAWPPCSALRQTQSQCLLKLRSRALLKASLVGGVHQGRLASPHSRSHFPTLSTMMFTSSLKLSRALASKSRTPSRISAVPSASRSDSFRYEPWSSHSPCRLFRADVKRPSSSKDLDLIDLEGSDSGSGLLAFDFSSRSCYELFTSLRRELELWFNL